MRVSNIKISMGHLDHSYLRYTLYVIKKYRFQHVVFSPISTVKPLQSHTENSSQ